MPDHSNPNNNNKFIMKPKKELGPKASCDCFAFSGDRNTFVSEEIEQTFFVVDFLMTSSVLEMHVFLELFEKLNLFAVISHFSSLSPVSSQMISNFAEVDKKKKKGKKNPYLNFFLLSLTDHFTHLRIFMHSSLCFPLQPS